MPTTPGFRINGTNLRVEPQPRNCSNKSGRLRSVFSKRLFGPPAPKFLVVSADQHVGNFPTAERLRPCVVGKIQNAALRNSQFAADPCVPCVPSSSTTRPILHQTNFAGWTR